MSEWKRGPYFSAHDWFAGLAMQALIGRCLTNPGGEVDPESVAGMAYTMAQAMIDERGGDATISVNASVDGELTTYRSGGD